MAAVAPHTVMNDLIYIGVIVGFFALGAFYVRLCDPS